MEKSGYDLKYVTSMDLHENYNTIANSKIYLSVHQVLWKQHVMEYDHIYQLYVDQHLIEEDQVLNRMK